MKFGALLPQMEAFQEPAAARDFAQGVEALGYHYLIAFEHVVGVDPADRPPGWRAAFTHRAFLHEPLVLFAFLGAVTTRLEFASSIIILPQRQTVLFAKQSAEVDYLTGGRLRLGLGIGWNAAEYETLNEDFHTRGARIGEQVEVLRALWTREVVDFKGRWHRLDRVGINPRPVQQPIPLWMGGSAEPVLRRTARIADGWMPLQSPHDPAFTATLGRLRAYVQQAGRREADVGVEGRISLANTTPEDWQRDLMAWRALRASHVGVSTTGGGLATPDQHMELLRGFQEVAAAIP